MKRLFMLLALLFLTAARDPILVPEVSQHEVQVRQGFRGTELLLFGAILTPEGTRTTWQLIESGPSPVDFSEQDHAQRLARG